MFFIDYSTAFSEIKWCTNSFTDYDNRTIQNMIVSSRKFVVEEQVEAPYRVRMTLSIMDFRTADSGRYQCQATNEWGQSNGTIRLYGT